MTTVKPLFAAAIALILLVISLGLPGCSAEAKKARHLKRADAYFASEEYEKAKIEYLNVSRADPHDAHVLHHLGAIWMKQGAPVRAYPYLERALELNPADVAIRTTKAELLLVLRQTAEARKEAGALLEVAPANGEAIKMLADSSRTPEEIVETEGYLRKYPERGSLPFHLASAMLALRKGDTGAVERSLHAARALAPKTPEVHTLVAALYLNQGKKAEALEAFKAAAEYAPPHSAERLTYANMKAQAGDVMEARRVLEKLTKEAPDYVPAWRAQAQIAFGEKRYDDALKLLERAFRTDAENLDGRVLQAEIWLATGETKKAIEVLKRAAEGHPAPIVKYQLGRAYLQDNDPGRAADALREAAAAAPDYVEPVLLLARLNLHDGDATVVVKAMTGLLKKRPALPEAQLMLVEAYRALGRFEEAGAIVREQIKASPAAHQLHLRLGVILRQQERIADARHSFQKALELAPDHLAAAVQLVALELSARDFAAASEVVDRLLAQTPASAGAYFLRARVHAAQEQWDPAEAALLKALELDPNFSNAYELLISIYVSTDQLRQALVHLGTVLTRDSANVHALLLSGMIHERLGEFTQARDAYEKLLATAPDSPVAQNNLACLYGERLNDPGKAYDLARKARTALPEDPAIADTLGWILYKRGEYSQAQSLIAEGAGKMPENAEVQFHLGMTHYMMGHTQAARTALEKALESPAEFPGKDDARSRVALLVDAAIPGSTRSVTELRSLLKAQPDDILALMLLGEAQEEQQAFAEAGHAYEAALKLNPKLVDPYTALARLHAGPLGIPAKAFEYAMKARELAPDDPETARILGDIAYQTGNFSWAYSLLNESVRRGPADASVLHKFAWAAYSLGKVAESREAMQRVHEIAPQTSEGADAKRFLLLLAIAESQRPSDTSHGEIKKALAADPQYAPALVARAAVHGQHGEREAAEAIYHQLLSRLPDFAPAQKELAALFADDPAQAARAYELATKARRNIPEDRGLARTLGILRFHRKEYSSAIPLLEETIQKKPSDAQALYYLGMAHYRLKEASPGRHALQRALAAGLPGPLAASATQVLSGKAQD